MSFEGNAEQTEVIDNSLNPVWNNEQFCFRVPEYFSESVVLFELWDKVLLVVSCRPVSWKR